MFSNQFFFILYHINLKNSDNAKLINNIFILKNDQFLLETMNFKIIT